MEPSLNQPHRLCFLSPTPERTRQAGACLSRAWRAGGHGDPGLEILLKGDLGAGKTVFVKGLALGLGLDPDAVSSPTFVLANQYPCPSGCMLHHADFYRLASFDELESMGFFDLGGVGAVLAVEWGDRFPDALSSDRLEVGFSRCEANGLEQRICHVEATGPVSVGQLERWRAALDQAGGYTEPEG
ncbi:MAG: tRNA (adenosine(37)-N6)-threonylcarbamoyltransferase complex ATPase subunit type 1 TsaE [Myxococcota bacterium]